MTDPKPGWERVRFGDVVRQVKDKVDPETSGLTRYVAGEHMDTDDLRIRRWGEIGDGYLGPAFHMRFKSGHVLYGSRRTYLRKIAVPDFEGICANTTFVLESADTSILVRELLPFVMQTAEFHEHSTRESKGSVNPYVNFSDLAWYTFALPSREEQQCLVKLLQASAANADAAHNLIGVAAMARQAAREAMGERSSCLSSTVGELCTMQNGKAFTSADYGNAGIRLLRPANLAQDGSLDWSPGRTVFLPEHYRVQADKFTVRPGDVVINLTAQSLEDGFMGRVCFARSSDESLLNQRIGRFANYHDGLVPEFLFRVLQGARFQAHARAMCEGTKVKHLFWRHIEGFAFPLPPVAEQREACDLLNAMDSACREATKRWESTLLLHRELLSRALRGVLA